jgi:TetR/AcrR family transcriptional regulator, mexJK operon transcriptional repressor
MSVPLLPPPRPRSRAPRLASAATILEAATTLFLRNGYLGTSMEDVARLAGVSKQTVYTHFADKEQLFHALMRGNIERAEEFIQAIDGMLQGIDAAGLEPVLTDLARRYVRVVIQPRVLQLRRLVIGEAGRFPDLARTYYERVPEHVVRVLAERFGQLAARGQLRLDEPLLAAHHFAWLVLMMPLDRGMFCGDDLDLTAAELDRLAAAGVRVFLSAYAPALEK